MNRIEALRDRGFTNIDTAIILGSGMSQCVHDLDVGARITYADIPDFPTPVDTPGHRGELVQVGRAVVFCGRFHGYEGYDARDLGAIPRLAHDFGCERVLITNASGGIRDDIAPGDLVVIRDHINLSGLNPLVGQLPIAFPAMAGAYDREWSDEIKLNLSKIAPTHGGVYVGVLGPSFETAAEIEAFRRLGADIIGMSTVHEVIAARALCMTVSAVSVVTNRAGSASDNHSEALSVANQRVATIQSLVKTLSQ